MLEQTTYCPRATQLYDYISKEENQAKVAAGGRAIIGVCSIITSPACAVAGATIATVGLFTLGSENTEWALNLTDAGVTKVWNKFDHNSKMIATGVALTVGVASGLILSVPALGSLLGLVPSIFAIKMSAEQVITNLKR